MKIQLNDNQQIIFYDFLEWATKEEPKNFSEWGGDYIKLCNIKRDLKSRIKEDFLEIDEDEVWSILDYLGQRIRDIFYDRLGLKLFEQYKDLHNVFFENSDCPYPVELFVVQNYDAELTPIKVNPLENPLKYLDL